MNAEELFFARLDELSARAEQGILTASTFLSPEERMRAAAYLERGGCRFCFRGGYEEAERSMVVFLPDYLEEEMLDTDELFLPIAIRTSGYVQLTHRSFLGALTALGIDRSAMGDILLFDWGAVLFAQPSVARFLLEDPSPLERVGADKVKVSLCDKKVLEGYRRSFLPFSDVIASERIDCAVAAFAGISREKAKAVTERGDVSLDYRVCTRPSEPIAEGSIISVRGVGKFKIEALVKTKKDRIRISAQRYN